MVRKGNYKGRLYPWDDWLRQKRLVLRKGEPAVVVEVVWRQRR
jgi:hypothetical protein